MHFLITVSFFSKPRVQTENEAFTKLMYEKDIPKCPVGYGYGVKQSDVFGVRGILRKEGFNCGANNTVALQNMEKVVANLTEENKGLVKQHNELKDKYDESNHFLQKMTSQFSEILDVLRSGKAPTEFFDLTKTVLHTANPQVSQYVEGHDAPIL